MGMLTWVVTGLAIWHFSIFIPDRFWGGIVGAFVGAVAGAALVGFVLSGLEVPGRNDTDLATALLAVPGAVLGMAGIWALGASRGNQPVHL